jgi:hypothetical protein
MVREQAAGIYPEQMMSWRKLHNIIARLPLSNFAGSPPDAPREGGLRPSHVISTARNAF